MEVLFIIIVLWIVHGIISRFTRKNDRSNTRPGRVDAVEEQRRRRMAYEAQQKQIARKVHEQATEDIPSAQWNSPLLEPMPLQTDIRPVSGSSTTIEKPRIVRSVKTAVEAVTQTVYQAKNIPLDKDADYVFPHPFERDQLMQGIVMAEILGPCRAKARQIRNV